MFVLRSTVYLFFPFLSQKIMKAIFYILEKQGAMKDSTSQRKLAAGRQR